MKPLIIVMTFFVEIYCLYELVYCYKNGFEEGLLRFRNFKKLEWIENRRLVESKYIYYLFGCGLSLFACILLKLIIIKQVL